MKPGTRLTADDLAARYKAGELNFEGVDLSGQDLAMAVLPRVNLEGANLRRTNLHFTNHCGANLRSAIGRDWHVCLRIALGI